MVDERRPIAFKTRFFDFPHRWAKRKNTLRIAIGRRFHTTILSGLFQAGQKAGLTNVVQLRSKRVFSTFPIGAKRKTPLGSIPLGRFHTTILSGLFQAGQKGGLTNVVQLRSKRVFSTFPIGAKRNNTLGIDSTRSVSYHLFEWAFPSRAKSRVDERRPIAFKTRFFDFPHRGESRNNTLGIDSTTFGFIPGFLPCLEKPTQNGGMKPT